MSYTFLSDTYYSIPYLSQKKGYAVQYRKKPYSLPTYLPTHPLEASLQTQHPLPKERVVAAEQRLVSPSVVVVAQLGAGRRDDWQRVREALDLNLDLDAFFA